MARTLSIWLPRLPLDRWVRAGDGRVDGAFAIIAEVKNAWRITHITDAAALAGVAPGLSLADARAICPDLLTEPADPAREAALLRALRRWADRLSPRIALDPPDGLLLDVTGCAHLFGGEAEMARFAIEELGQLSVVARAGIADTKHGAHALARFGRSPIAVAPVGETSRALAPLPLAALGLEERMTRELARTGLKTIGALYTVKSGELARRFGLELVKALHSALGQVADPIVPAASQTIYAARMSLPEPVGLVSEIEAVLERLAQSVCARLTTDQKGARAFLLTVHAVDTGDHHLRAGFARPCSDANPVLQQFARPLSQLELPFGADGFRLVAEHVEPVRYRQADMNDAVHEHSDLAQLLTTLGNRIGFDQVRAYAPRASHLPEREYAIIEAVDARERRDWALATRQRPLRLLSPVEPVISLEPGRPPRRFKWRRDEFTCTAAKGPERLTAEWWRDTDLRTRDYWTVQTEEGPRLWLLTYPGTREPRWYMAGRFP